MATFAENIAAVEVLVSDVDGIQATADIDIAAKQSEIDTLAATMMTQEETCGHESWSKVADEYKLECDACGKIVEFSDPTILWPWMG